MCLREESEPHTYDSSGILAYFNPRFREGSDTYADPGPTRVPDFNPRFREGSDRTPLGVKCLTKYFNPHFREGSDSTYAQLFAHHNIYNEPHKIILLFFHSAVNLIKTLQFFSANPTLILCVLPIRTRHFH